MNKQLNIASKHIQQLREVVNVGNPGKKVKDGVLELEMVEGKATSIRIFCNNEISIAKLYVREGGVFAPHLHRACREVIQVLDGELHIWFNETLNSYMFKKPQKIIKKYEAVIIEPNVVHLVKAEESSMVIVSAMPADPTFP